ncbi:MAG: septal ring lytic transglycosylase RlpA family protein [Zoogloeaceae bacterium]|jgi:rare lipoprotein A|nr:septal ring lytic transglycosylase RlpA family protein [Zoogloeaceae bacterium]
MFSALLLALLIASCGSPAPKSTRGGFYQDDGPSDSVPADLGAIPDAVPRAEPPHRAANRPYSVLGRDYVPLKPNTPYRVTGVASWYGKKFHGQKTSIGETYDMYAMTAAHPTLSIPSYARVTNQANGKSVIVRVNDRGPFLHGRLIDLSYAAAYKLGYVNAGSAQVVVESILPGSTLPPPVTVTVESVAPQPLPEISDTQGIYLQLGAFGNADNADNLQRRLARELGSLGDRLVVRSGSDGVYRVQIGPWASHAEAQRIADQLAELLDARPIIVHR